MSLVLWELRKLVRNLHTLIAVIVLLLTTSLYCYNEYRILTDYLDINKYNIMVADYEGIPISDVLRKVQKDDNFNSDESNNRYFSNRLEDLIEKSQVLNFDLDFYNNLGTEQLFRFIFTTRSSVFLCFFIVIIVSTLFSNEYELNMTNTIISTVKGNKYIISMKIFSNILFICLIYTIYYIFTIFITMIMYGNPSQLFYLLESTTQFLGTPYSWSVATFLLINYAFSILHITTFIFIIGFISLIAKKNLVSFFISSIISFLPLFSENNTINMIITPLSPMLSLSAINVFAHDNYINLFNQKILHYQLSIIICMVLILTSWFFMNRYLYKKIFRGYSH